MLKILVGLWLATYLIPAMAGIENLSPAKAVQTKKSVPDSGQLEKGLQSLNWKQFKSVVEAIPRIRTEIDKYGPLGWQYVQRHYKTYAWNKPIDRLEVWQKHELARLIKRARKAG